MLIVEPITSPPWNETETVNLWIVMQIVYSTMLCLVVRTKK